MPSRTKWMFCLPALRKNPAQGSRIRRHWRIQPGIIFNLMDQEEALNILKMGYNVFLTGPPGSGKTFLLNKYIDYLKKNKKSVVITDSTGIAATHMNGTTLHSWSGLGIKETLTKNDIKKLMKKSYLRKHYKNTRILIIDEISMLTAAQ